MTPDLVWSRLRKRFGLIAGATCDQQEDKEASDDSGPTLSHTALSMIHSHPLPSKLLVMPGPQQALHCEDSPQLNTVARYCRPFQDFLILR
jgi:hypothetical protein